jgi:hypothetical protein
MVSTKDTLGIDDTVPYVEVGHLKRNGIDYIVVVNRRCADNAENNDTRDIMFTLRPRSVAWQVTDIETNRSWSVRQGERLVDRFKPGEGKIYRLR